MCAFLQAAARKRNVSGDHDVVRLHVFDNPIIGCVEFVLYNFECNPSFIRNSHPRVGHQCDIKAISACDTVHLLFDRARISIYKDVQQMKILTITPDLVRVPPNGEFSGPRRGAVGVAKSASFLTVHCNGLLCD